MSFTNVSSDINELHRIWLCNQCFGRFFLTGFYGGVTVEIETNAIRSTSLALASSDGGISIPDFTSRDYSKSTTWNDAYFDPHAYVDNPEQTWSTYWGNIAEGCWGATEREFNGSYQVNSSYSSGKIYYADLRDDILVYYSENGGHSASDSGDEPMGFHQAYASWNGGEPACQGVNITDAIQLEPAVSAEFHNAEKITLGSYTPYSHSTAEASVLSVAISDEFSQINTMAIINESKPYSCKDGVFTELILHNGWTRITTHGIRLVI